MKHFRFFLLISFFVAAAWVQPAVSRAAAPVPTAPEQRRAELRLALKEPRGPEEAGKDQTPAKIPAKRHLTEQERSELRQQLHQQQRQGGPDF
jgi:hypothetical protein